MWLSSVVSNSLPLSSFHRQFLRRQSEKKAQAGMVSPIRPVPRVENVPDYLLEIERRQSKEELLQIVYCFSFFEA
jgi:hypothetical protein